MNELINSYSVDIAELEQDKAELQRQLKYAKDMKWLEEMRIREIREMFKEYDMLAEELRARRQEIMRKLDEING